MTSAAFSIQQPYSVSTIQSDFQLTTFRAGFKYPSSSFVNYNTAMAAGIAPNGGQYWFGNISTLANQTATATTAATKATVGSHPGLIDATTVRGGGFHDANDISFIVGIGSQDGINGETGLPYQKMYIGGGTFAIGQLGATSILGLTTNGVAQIGTTQTFAASLSYYDSNGANRQIAISPATLAASKNGSDPLIAYSDLTLLGLASNNAATGSFAITAPSAGAKYLTGQAITVNGTLGNTAASPADALVVALSDNGGDLTVSGFSADSATVAQGGSTSWTASANSGSVSGAKTLNVKNTDAASTNSPQTASTTVQVFEPISIGGTGANITNAAAIGVQRAAAKITTAGTVDNAHFTLSGLDLNTVINAGGNTGSASLTVAGRLNGTHKGTVSVDVGYDDNTIVGISGPSTLTRSVSQVVSGNVTTIGIGTAFGSADNANVQTNDKIAGLSSTSSGLGNVLSFLDSDTLLSPVTVSASWRHRSAQESPQTGTTPPLPALIESGLITDVAQVVFTDGAPTSYAIQMSYDPNALGGVSEEYTFLANHLYLAHMTPGINGINGDGDDQWAQAGTGAGFLRAYQASDLSTIGSWGVDTVNHVAWAVLSGGTAGQFAVVPEPASLGLLALGALGLIRRRK